MPEPVRVEGIPEAQAAYRKVGRTIDYGAAAEAAGKEMIPDIRTFTRKDSGALALGWGVESDDKEAAFVNTQDYWTYQEFGTENVDPTLAIFRSWERNEKDVVKSYDEEVTKKAANAGFTQR
jgi:bacteriophage HK97-gp10 putative tail-component